MQNFTIRPATPNDVHSILSFIKMLADYENMSDDVSATEEMLLDELFTKHSAEVIIAEEGGIAVGFALYFTNFSTFLAKTGMHLEDLFVIPAYRGKGYGKALLRHLAYIAESRGYGRMEWACLDWNKPSIDFYLSLGAEPLADWTTYRLSDKTLTQNAKEYK
ncbi:MAG: GNAT family N-acetyltransferase [Bacillota bacterium]